MKDKVTISIFEVTGTTHCISQSDGQKVYDHIRSFLDEGVNNIVFSFKNIVSLTPAFLNAAIGQLYGTFSKKDIQALFKVQDMQGEDIVLLKHVNETAEHYFE